MSSLTFAQDWVENGGIKFHSSCEKNFGKDFSKNIHEGFKIGLSCLKRLNTPQTKNHASKISDLISSGKLLIGCHQDSYFKKSKTSAAHASLGSREDDPETGLFHPYFAFNSLLANESWYDEQFIKTTAFHESFHIIGYAHGRTEEYAYACDECCFSNNEKAKAMACKVCSRSYDNGLKDPNYMEDFMDYHKVSDEQKYLRAPVVIRRGLIMNPQSVIHREILLDYDSSQNPVAIYSAKEWLDAIQSEFILSLSGKKLSDAALEHAALLETIHKTRKYLLNNEISASIDSFLETDVESMKQYFAINPEEAILVWYSLFEDVDTLIDVVYTTDRRDLEDVFKKYDELIATRPTNQ